MKVFISYSHEDAHWLERLRVHLRPLEREGHIEVWADTRLEPGETWLQNIQQAIADAQAAVLLVSADFLASEFIASNELPPLLLAAKRGDCRVVPVILGPCLFSSIRNLQEFQAVNSPGEPLTGMTENQAEEVLNKVARTVLDRASQRNAKAEIQPLQRELVPLPATTGNGFAGSPEVDALIARVKLGAWQAAERVALQVLSRTDCAGRNEIFEVLLGYQDCSDEDDRFWGATHTLECCLRLAPWLISHSQLRRLAEHKNFSVRSLAASICMNMAHSAPDRVPIDILLKLSVYNENWYVMTPANSAIKAMANSLPSVLNIFYERLRSPLSQARSHAAVALKDVAEKEPFLLDGDILRVELKRLEKLGDEETADYVKSVLKILEGITRKPPYRYGL